MSWIIQSQAVDMEQILLEESLFFNGNGYVGVRGNVEMPGSKEFQSIHGTYVNGFYDNEDITYGERLNGFPKTQQRLVNVIDAQTIEVWVGEGSEAERVSLWTGQVVNYTRRLHMDKGYTERRLHWKSASGYELVVTFIRLASFTCKSLFLQQILLEPLSGPMPVKIVSRVNGDVQNFTDPADPRVGNGHAKRLHVRDISLTENHHSYVEVETYQSELRLAALANMDVHTTSHVGYDYGVQTNAINTSAQFILTEPCSVEKRTYYLDSVRASQDGLPVELITEQDEDSSRLLGGRLLDLERHYKHVDVSQLLQEQENYMYQFWRHGDVQIIGNEKLQEGIRFNIFHLLQSAGQDGVSNISAKGLSGEGYEGHYFWDTEIYMLPMFTMTEPEMAKQLLLYRYSILDNARDRANEMGHQQGALFPWRTISGTECSPFFPAGTAQYHISADIAYSFVHYYLATGDIDFLVKYGAEILIETARLWIDTGHFSNGQFRIDSVTGPDEYTCIVNNNYYTNVMAKYNLTWALKSQELLKRHDHEVWDELQNRLQVRNEELEQFEQARDNMFLPVDDQLQVNPQDDTFLQKKVWDFAATPKENYPLLLHYHPLTLYRYQVCKQADTVLAHFLVEDEQSEDVMQASFDYYEKVTTFDSSLSLCVFSMMASRFGDVDKAYSYFIDTVRMDLDNTHGNTRDGLHMANMGGTWLALVYGFTGMRLKETGLWFRPRLPKQWDGYAFRLRYQGSLLHIAVSEGQFKAAVFEGGSVAIHVWEGQYTVENEKPVVIPMR